MDNQIRSNPKLVKANTESSSNIINLLKAIINSIEGYTALSLIIAGVSIVTIFLIAADECRTCFIRLNEKTETATNNDLKKFRVYGKNIDSGYLEHVFVMLKRFGYENDSNSTEWDLLWAHDYPFRSLYHQLNNLKRHQKVNHFPGCGYLTNKVDLAVSGLKYIPRAFKLPIQKEKFLNYAQQNPEKSFVQKNNDHRNIKVKKIKDIDLNSKRTFIQEFVDRPLLVSGHKFDIGIYTVITSVDPLRIYIYNGDALLRFCSVEYYPFDSEDINKYVVGDNYLPVWEVPALDLYYNQLGFGMKESLNAYLESQGQNSNTIWEQIEDAIKVVILDKEPKLLEVMNNKFRSKRNFFEMMRFDFVVDENLNVYLLEANMSPNLSSAHYPPNQLMYEQVLYNIMGLLGLAERVRKNSLAVRSESEEQMIVSDKNLVTFPKECNSILCRTSCVSPICQLCRPCLSPDSREYLVEAYKEHLNRGDCKRIFPPKMNANGTIGTELDQYSSENQLQYRWFFGKCQLDPSWC